MHNSRMQCCVGLIALLLAAAVASSAWASTGSAVQARIRDDLVAEKPIVIHVVVALCDNENQGIVPVPQALGNGQNPQTNLYWGALYGVRTHLPRASGWIRIDSEQSGDPRVLDRVVFFARQSRGERSVPVYMVADAWDGANIRDALQTFFAMSAGGSAETVAVNHGSEVLELHAGGASHLLVYVGHNGLMEFTLEMPSPPAKKATPRSAMVLACASKSYFLEYLQLLDAHPLLLTTGLMAPEAYTLDSAIQSWVGGSGTDAVVEAAAEAYNQYQKCGIRGARRLFWGAP